MLLGDPDCKAYLPFLVMESPPAADAERDSTNNKDRREFSPLVWKEIAAIERAQHTNLRQQVCMVERTPF